VATVPYTLIDGQFKILNTAPDGDSVRFYPDTADAFTRAGLTVRVNKAGGAQLRLEAIDTPETHYTPPVGGTHALHQPLAEGRGAASRLLELLGFTHVERGPDETVTASDPAAVPGHIVTKATDKYGRCIAFAFAGRAAGDDVRSIFLDAGKVAESANQRLVEDGSAYVTFYSSLFADLRAGLADAARKAEAAQQGVWLIDATTDGLTLESLSTITDRRLVLPKLFRRLADYLAINAGDPDLGGFLAFVAAHGDRVIRTDTAAVTGFDNVIEVDGQTVRMTLDPSELVFLE
jgi:endonuclease YncB( thermonuclease family)